MTDKTPAKKRGRPSNDQIEARLMERLIASGRLAPLPSTVAQTDEEVLAEIKERFDVMGILIDGAIAGNVRSLMIAGAPGVGKSHTVIQKLKDARTFGDTRFEIISGGISAIGLYKLGYRMRQANRVIVLDDSDGIFADDESLGILKALCDSSQYRTVNWLKESAALKEDGEEIPTSYEFNGTMVFITNLDIQQHIDTGSSKFVPHFQALESRSLYLDLLIHDRRQLGIWVNHMAATADMFSKYNFTKKDTDVILTYLNVNRDKLRSLSLRTVITASDIYNTHKEKFEMIANNTLLRARL